MTEKTKNINKRKGWFRFVKCIVRLFIKKTEFEYDEDIPKPGSIILCNHAGTAAPLAWELYGDVSFRFWGANEMNSGLIKLYKYQTRVFYHEKKGWNIHLARLFCLLASPLTYMFYAGLNLISTYHDVRFKHTLTESIKTLEKEQSLVIFPEISDNGYLDVLEGFHKGFVMLAGICHKRGMNVPVHVAYFKKGEPKRMLVSKSYTLDELFAEGKSRDEIAVFLCKECNTLGERLRGESVKEKVQSDNAAIG